MVIARILSRPSGSSAARTVQPCRDARCSPRQRCGVLREFLEFRDSQSTLSQADENAATPREHARLRHVHSVDPEAHAAYLRGRYYWHQSFTETAFRSAIRHF